MAKFTVEQAADVAAIQQLINDWVFELDFHHGINISDIVTEDCSYQLGDGMRQGRQTIVEAYRLRLDRLASSPATSRPCGT